MKKFSYILIFTIASFSLFSNYKKFIMTVQEINIFKSVASSSYEFDPDYLDKISKLYPNLSSSAIPIKGILGGYYVTHDSIRKGINLLKQANKDNPFIGFPDMILGRVYEVLGQKDSFNLYTLRAYNKLPNNSASYLLLAKKLLNENKIDSLSYFFDEISDRVSDTNIWQIYLAAMFSINDNYAEYNVDSTSVISNAKKAKIFTDDNTVRLISDYIIYGKEKVIANLNKYEKAKDTFDIDPVYAINSMKEVLGDIGDNFDYYETTIEMNFKVEDYKSVINLFSEMKNKEMTALKANIIEMISISYLYNNDINSGCELAILLNDGNYNLDSTVKLLCRIN